MPYAGVARGNPYNTIYGQFVNYGPMQRWAAGEEESEWAAGEEEGERYYDIK